MAANVIEKLIGQTMSFDRRFFLLSLVLVLLLPACSTEDTEDTPTAPVTPSAAPAESANLVKFDSATTLSVRQILRSYIQQIETDYSELNSSVESLVASTNALLQGPSEFALAAAQESWTNAHTVFEQTAVHRYFSYRVVPEAQSLRLFELQYQMNQWPILAGYVDSVEGYMGSGIVHDVNVELTPETLRQQHGLFDVTEATLGFHVIEFLLWGEADSSSQRIAGDFEQISTLTADQSESGLEVNQLSNNRRREMLRLTSRLLLEDVQASELIWREGLERLESNGADISAERIVSLFLDSTSSMLTEELLVKSLYPMLNNEFEVSLQSPFSQTSQSAVAAQMRGVESLILETAANDGSTLDKVLVSLSADFEGFFYQNLDSGKACLILLYNKIGASDFSGPSAAIEFETVECINLITNLVDQLEQIELTLPNYSVAI